MWSPPPGHTAPELGVLPKLQARGQLVVYKGDIRGCGFKIERGIPLGSFDRLRVEAPFTLVAHDECVVFRFLRR